MVGTSPSASMSPPSMDRPWFDEKVVVSRAAANTSAKRDSTWIPAWPVRAATPS